MIKFQIPSTKFQTNHNDQIPMTKTPHPNPLSFGEREGVRGNLVIGYWNLFGIWNLGFGIFFVIWFLLTGCEQLDMETLNKITQEDPSFKTVLEKKQELDSKINVLLGQIKDLKIDTYAKIRVLEENFNKQKREINSKLASLKSELEPERMTIRQDIEALRATISSKKEILKNLESTRRNLTNLINQQKAVSVTQEDMEKWQERLADLNKQIEPFAGEVRELEEKLRLLRLRLIALRQ